MMMFTFDDDDTITVARTGRKGTLDYGANIVV
jgi:hypothetical protein